MIYLLIGFLLLFFVWGTYLLCCKVFGDENVDATICAVLTIGPFLFFILFGIWLAGFVVYQIYGKLFL